MSRMPRILTAETTPETVKALKRVAKQNKRSAGKEALVAIQSHVLNEATKLLRKRAKRRA